jgi:sensor histidine kinase YesM
METIRYKRLLVTVLHLLFWIISFNAFNSFFSRGVESAFALDGFEVTWWNILLVTNFIVVIILMPFIWFFKGIKRWIKWGITSVTLTFIVWGVIQFIYPNKDNESLLVPLIIVFFMDNFLYVLTFHLTIIAAVYLNINILIKRYLSQGRFGIYLVNAFGLAVVAGIINYALFDFCIDLVFPQFFYISWFTTGELILIMTGYIAITTIAFLLWQYWLMLIANRAKVQNELSSLKAQINPHFLFNNLNTIYALASKGDLRTKDVILQLSDFLRYVLYDTSSEKIQLEKEIEIIKTYVGLQKERINLDITAIILNIEGDFSGALIAPLLLLPLAENCFKHGIGNNKGTIRIDISYSGRQLHFNTKNPVAHREDPVENGQERIGIKNVEKRLNLLYPDKHSLNFAEDGGIFKVEMKIDLD